MEPTVAPGGGLSPPTRRELAHREEGARPLALFVAGISYTFVDKEQNRLVGISSLFSLTFVGEGGKAKRSDREEKRNKNRAYGPLANGILKWRPRGTGEWGPEGNRKWGAGRTDRQMSAAAQEQN